MLRYQTVTIPCFLDYMKHGWSLQTVCGIDFTASNGSPSSKSSLHSFGPNNQYLKTLGELIPVLEAFDQQIEVYGFGAQPRHMGS